MAKGKKGGASNKGGSTDKTPAKTVEKEYNPEVLDSELEGIQPVMDVAGEPDVEADFDIPGDSEISDGAEASEVEFVDEASPAEDVEGNAEAPEEYILLSDEQKAKIIAEAKKMAKEDAIKDAKENFMKSELAKAKAKEDAKQGINTKEKMVRHKVNLASSAAFHLINFKQYFHGHTYDIPESVAKGMRDTEYRGHVQEAIRKGNNNKNEYGLVEREGFASGPVQAGGGSVKPGGVVAV